MTYYPKTDEDWERLAECIVTKHPSVSPELVGGFTVDATQTIFTWYKGEERRRALDERQYARDRLIELAKEAGCMGKPEYIAPGRPFPQTFGDWTNLAIDIKEKDPRLAPEVNEYLGYIFTDDPTYSEEGKRWLVEKGGELGIT